MEVKTQKFYSISEVADMLGVSPITVRRLIWNRELDAIKVGRSIRIAIEDMENYIQKNKIKKEPSKAEINLEGMFIEGDPIPKEAIDKVISEWEKE